MTQVAAIREHSWTDAPELEASQPAVACKGSANSAAAVCSTGGGRRRPATVTKPSRPDDSETRAIIQKLQETIVKHKKRAEDITASIDAKRSGHAKATPQQAALKSRLGELRTVLQPLLAQQQALHAQLDVATDAQERTRESLKQLKTGTRFTRVENIDEQIAELEARLSGSSINLSGGELVGDERQRVQRQLAALQRSRSHVEELRRSASARDSSTVDELRARVASLDEQIGKARAEESGLRDQLAGFKAAEAEETGDLPELIRERDECKAICRAAYSKVAELRRELDEQWAAFKQQNVLYHQQQVERRERHQEYLRRKAAREAVHTQQEQAGGAEGEAEGAAEGAAEKVPKTEEEGAADEAVEGCDAEEPKPHGRSNGSRPRGRGSGLSGRGTGRGGRGGGRGWGGHGKGRGQPAEHPAVAAPPAIALAEEPAEAEA